MKGYIFVSPRSDPGAGVPLTDPSFGKWTTMGACRPDLRRNVQVGDHIFVISGTTKGVSQYIIGGFSVDEKIDMLAAYKRFPDYRLRIEDGRKFGNIIMDKEGHQLQIDRHTKFEKRVENYIVGRQAVYLEKPQEILLGRERSVEILSEVFGVDRATKVREIIGRNRKLDDKQIDKLLQALQQIKADAARV